MMFYSIIKFLYHKILITYFIFFIIGNQISNAIENASNNQSVCQTPLCKEIATSFINSMDQSVDPCNDFFAYACGNFGKIVKYKDRNTNYFSLIRNFTNHQIKEILESDWTPSENIALTKSKQLYKSCINEKVIEKRGLKDLWSFLNDLGGWPMALSRMEWRFRQKSWQEVDLQIRKNIGVGPFFVLAPAPDIKNSSFNIQWLTPPAAALDSPIFLHEFLLNKQDNNSVSLTLKQYRKSIVDSAKLIGHYHGAYMTKYDLDIDAERIIKFELAFKEILSKVTSNLSVDLTSNYKKLTINELQEKCDANSPKTSNGKINWLYYMRRLYSSVPNVHIDGSNVIALVGEEYIMKLIDLLDETPSRVIVNTMHWWVVKNLARFTNRKLTNITSPKKNGDSSKKWKWCINQNEMPHAIAQAYVQKYLPKESKRYVNNMVNEITFGMKNDINQSEWLDSYSKSNALKKLSLMKKFVGYPDWYDDDKSVTNLYENITVGTSFFKNSLEIMRSTYQTDLESVGQPVHKEMWIASPTAINAFYYYPGNSLTIPAGILQVPFFNGKLPDALNYGAIGSFIGHEISHGFDDVGSQYDENGNVRDWWSSNIKSEYNKRARCFIKKFSKYVIKSKQQSYKLDSIHTLSENIADTTGINAVYKAFTIHSMKHPAQANIKLPGLEHLDSKKLLFLSWAHSFCTRPKLDDLLKAIKIDMHSPASFRIIGTLSNMNTFSDTYQCAKGTPMNPADPVDKCGIW